jgi:glycosyltransferase involved in cell wall biosynthesis
VSTNSKGNSLSAIIPIWNYSLHKQNIRTLLLDLTQFEIEVILVLDSESPESLVDIEKLVKQLKLSVKIIQIEAGNPGDTRNKGKQNATRDWIVFWDCDDLPIIETYINMITQAELETAQLVVAAYKNENKLTHNVINHEIESKNSGINMGLNPGIWRMTFQREFIQKIDFPSLSMGEDQVFLARVLNLDPIVSYLNEYAYVYGTGVESQLTSESHRKKDISKAYELLAKEHKSSRKHAKIVSTMLLRQGITFLKQPELKFYRKLKTGLGLFALTISNTDILKLYIKYKISESKRVRASH